MLVREQGYRPSYTKLSDEKEGRSFHDSTEEEVKAGRYIKGLRV